VGVGSADALGAAHLVLTDTAALTLARLREAHEAAFGRTDAPGRDVGSM
jgi:hypothetical protein